MNDSNSCVLCGEALERIEYNLKTSYSMHSKTLLITHLKNLTELLDVHYNVCLQCFNLINELDFLELRQKEIHCNFKKYLLSRQQSNRKVLVNLEVNRNINIHLPNSSDVLIDVLNDQEVIKQEWKDEALVIKSEGELHINQELIRVLNKTNSELVINGIDELSKFNSNQGGLGGRQPAQEIGGNQNICIRESTNSEFKEISIGNLKKKCGRKKKNLDTAKPHKCHCSKTFRSAGELKNHMATHDSHKPFVCEICGQTYKNKSGFTIHIGMHNGINPFTCTFCKKSFTQKGALMRHMPIHTGEMPYQCDQCGRRFIHHTSFSIHRLSHSGQKSYKCSLCGLALMSGSHLKRHMRVHTGEKKFSCITCGKKFAEKYNLAVHEKVHSNSGSLIRKREYRCQICGIGFCKKIQLECHLVEHDKEELGSVKELSQ